MHVPFCCVLSTHSSSPSSPQHTLSLAALAQTDLFSLLPSESYSLSLHQHVYTIYILEACKIVNLKLLETLKIMEDWRENVWKTWRKRKSSDSQLRRLWANELIYLSIGFLIHSKQNARYPIRLWDMNERRHLKCLAQCMAHSEVLNRC